MLNRFVCWTCPVWLCLASAAPAELVIDRQPFNTGGPAADTSFVIQTGGVLWQQVADDFVLAQSAVIRHVTWWGFYGDDFESPAEQPPATQTMRVRFYGSRINDGLPGVVLYEETFADPPYAWTGRQVLTGAVPNEYKFDVDLTSPFSLTASTPYWLEIVQLESLNSHYRWEISVATRDGYAFLNDSTGDWVHTGSAAPATLAFQLSTIPEPGTAMLLLLGSSLAMRRTRRLAATSVATTPNPLCHRMSSSQSA
ncbi:hypothetical protein B7486_04110 [cyanobacterium TDX16]|nr:hypothetical protein B7486_04110 [cyanobacterium TDX16]